MKKIILVTFIFFIQSTQISAYEPKLQKVVDGLDGPWSLSFINDYTVLVTEKSGDIMLIDINKKKIKDIKHNLNILEDGQGGLLEVLYSKGQVYVSYSENLKNGYSATSVASAKFNETIL